MRIIEKIITYDQIQQSTFLININTIICSSPRMPNKNKLNKAFNFTMQIKKRRSTANCDMKLTNLNKLKTAH